MHTVLFTLSQCRKEPQKCLGFPWIIGHLYFTFTPLSFSGTLPLNFLGKSILEGLGGGISHEDGGGGVGWWGHTQYFFSSKENPDKSLRLNVMTLQHFLPRLRHQIARRERSHLRRTQHLHRWQDNHGSVYVLLYVQEVLTHFIQ